MISDNSQSIDNKVELEALNAVFTAMKGGSLASLISPLIVVIVMWSQIENWVLLSWGVLIVAGIAAQTWLVNSYLTQDSSTRDAKYWGKRLTAIFFYFALLWAASVFLFYVENSLEHQLFILTLVITLSIWTLVVGQYWYPLYYLYGPITLAAVIFRLIMEGSPAHYGLAALLLWVGLTTLFVAKTLNNTVRSEIRLRQESVILNAELEKKVSEAEKATLSKSKFLAAASHDLRQPLHSLSLFLDVLKSADSDAERNAILPRVDASLDALRKLFDALLDISKLDANAVTPEPNHFRLSVLLNEIADEFTPVANNKGIKFTIRCKDAVVITDKLLLERILRNLVANAIRYTQSGRVLLSCRIYEQEVLIQVWDTGIGIPKDCFELIFEEFQQLDNSHRDRRRGLGLGLSMVRRQCKLLNLPLQFNSIPGKGSVFSVRVPRGSEDFVERAQKKDNLSRWNLTGRTILVIDDEKEILVAMKTLLVRWGCEVITADSLKDAEIKLAQSALIPELIISDLRLKEHQSGLEAISTIQSKYEKQIPGIIVTGETAPEQLKLAKKSHLEILHKPLRPMHLRSVIHHYLSTTRT